MLESINSDNAKSSLQSTYYLWKADKPLFGSSLCMFFLLAVLLSGSVYLFLNGQVMQGRIASIKIDVQKKTYLTIKLKDDDRIFYQAYERRFYEPAIQYLHPNETIRFFTFRSPELKRAAISSLGDQSSFYYYPIFNINRPAGLLQVIYFNFYNRLIQDILLYIFFVASLYNGFYIFVKAHWLIKGPLILFLMAMVWVVWP
jgi:hypothetical protein